MGQDHYTTGGLQRASFSLFLPARAFAGFQKAAVKQRENVIK